MNFSWNQPNATKSCGYRCLYYVLSPKEPYEQWLGDNFKFFDPTNFGIQFNDICEVLKYHKKEYKFTQLTEEGLYIVYSGVWLHIDGKKHGHYFIYHNGVVNCSTKSGPYKMPLSQVISRLESKTTETAFRILKIT